jgi:phage shock protein C
MMKRLYRERTDRMLAGVCAGLAKNLDVDPVLVRVGFILGTFANGIGILAYLILWILVPRRPYAHDLYPDAEGLSDNSPSQPMFSPAVIFGGILIAVGMLALIDMIVPGLDMEQFWPFILIALGIGLIVRSARAQALRQQEHVTGQEEPRSSL